MNKSVVFPKYQTKGLLIGNKDSKIGVVTLWSEKEKVAKHLNDDKYCVIGQLYSANGINYIIRNCLANKNIRFIVMTGEDLSGTGSILYDLFNKGVMDHKIIGRDDFIIDEEIPDRAIDEFLDNVFLIDCRDEKDYSLVNGVLIQTEAKNGHLESYGEPEIFPEKKIDYDGFYPSERAGYIVREDSIGDAWISLLDNILRFGTYKPSSYSEDQIELLDLMTVTNEPMDFKDNGESIVDFKEYYLFNKIHLEDYYNQIITSKPFSGINYTYGQRLRSYFSIDQIEEIINELKREKFSRRAVGITWDVINDSNSSHAPCLDLIQCNIQDDKLFLTAYIRSNDMVKAWPENAYGLRRLQKLISDQVGVEMGSMITISCSAHIYDSDIGFVKNLVDIYRNDVIDNHDPRGNFEITVIEDQVRVYLMNIKTGERIDLFIGYTAEELSKKLIEKHVVSNPYHCMYLGRELQRAEWCAKTGVEYVQS